MPPGRKARGPGGSKGGGVQLLGALGDLLTSSEGLVLGPKGLMGGLCPLGFSRGLCPLGLKGPPGRGGRWCWCGWVGGGG